MKIIEPSFEFMHSIIGKQILESIERAGRICYKSESKITSDSAKEFIKKNYNQDMNL
jgi:thymidylate synthase (FAD)